MRVTIFGVERVLRFMPRAGLTGVLLVLISCSRGPSAEKGESLYKANGCATCHGATGRGDGFLAPKLPVKPANLRDPSQFKRGTSEAEIAETLAEGIVNVDASTPQLHHDHHDLAMPRFDHLTEMERRSIALYVISMQKSSN